MSFNLLERLLKIYQISRPVLFVLVLAALIVFINSYPNVPGIAEETNDYRLSVKSRLDTNQTVHDEIEIDRPSSPSLPNTITPVVSPEEVDKLVNPKPKVEVVPDPNQAGQANETNMTSPDIPAEQGEPALEIKLLTGVLNVAPLILVALLGGFGIYLLFKYKKHFTLRTMFGVAIALVAICSILFFSIIAINFLEFIYDSDWDIDILLWGILPFAAIIGGLISFLIISKKTTVFRRNIGLTLAGALMGSFMATFLPIWLIFILLIAISLFDIYSVKFGPIKKILELDELKDRSIEKKVEKRVVYRKAKGVSIKKEAKTEEDLDLMLMFENPDWSLGLGDFVIYSMFTSVVLTYTLVYLPYYIFYSPALGLILPWVIFLVCVVGLIFGFLITLKLLEKHEYLPGLPISIGFGLLAFMICMIILQLVNYMLFNEFAIII